MLRNPHRNTNHHRPPVRERRGVVLFVVLVVIVLLTLAAYQYSAVMTTEYQSSHAYGRRVQARMSADSGVDVAASMLASRQLLVADDAAEMNLYHNPSVFGARGMAGLDSSGARFSVLSPDESDPNSKTVRFGLADESSKLNLNTLLKLTGDDEEGRFAAVDILLGIPGMTEDIAESILDWIDKDDETSFSVSEEDVYGAILKNGPLESLDELLLLPDITPSLLFGADANRNGVVDADEFELAQQSDDMHPLGWTVFLTVHSRESNVRLEDGEARLNVNEGLLTELYDQLEEEFADDGNAEAIAMFIVAYRMNGASNVEEEDDLAGLGVATGSSSSRGGQQALQKAALGIAKAIGGAAASGGMVTRGGMDLAGGAKVKINSLYDLVDAEVEVEVDGTMETLSSPWTTEEMLSYLPDLMDRLSTTDAESIEGRINVNQAREEVLLAVIRSVEGFGEDEAGLAESLAQTIVSEKMIGDDGQPLSNVMADRQSTGWLVANGHVTLAQMRQLDRYLTTRGDVYRAQVIGYFDRGGPVSRQEVVIDASKKPARIVFQRDLTDLGKGFTPTQLGSPTDP